jgi:nucleoside-diphosphate-sugar epimerase
VAERLLRRGAQVTVTSRHIHRLDDLQAAGARAIWFEAGDPDSRERLTGALQEDLLVLDSVPLIDTADGLRDPTPCILRVLGSRPVRVVYLSTTGVYGAQHVVDERTPPAPRSRRESMRVDAENAVLAGSWSALVLRPAAIYGPGRGVHVAMRKGTFRFFGDGTNHISRIHVDDLATHAEAALFSSVTGAYPVADEEPCTSREIAEFCSDLLGVPTPVSARGSDLHDSRRADRRVDGSAIRSLLGVRLQYPSYRSGIPASLAEEAHAGLE